VVEVEGEISLRVRIDGEDSQLEFTPELAYLPTTAGIEIHALLHHEQRQLSSLLETDEYDERIESLIDAGIDPKAIRLVYSKGRPVAV
jgi:hypothetical protein